jgi:hypothetical protein
MTVQGAGCRVQSARCTVRSAGCAVRSALALVLVLLTASAASAQAPKQQKPKRPKALSFGGVWVAPVSFGTATATLERPDGSSLVVFRADNDLGMGLGVEASLGFELRRHLWADVTGGWVVSELQTKVSDDVESAADTTVTESLSRFTVEGAVLWYFREKGRTSYFVRGGAGWMRELTGSSSLAQDGVVGNGGIGVQHWWRDNAKGAFRRVGFSADFRLNFRSESLSQVESKPRVSPAAAGKLVIGF